MYRPKMISGEETVKIAAASCILAATLTTWIPVQAQSGGPQAPLKRVAVYDFDDKAVATEVKLAYGEKKDVGALVAREVVARLVNSSAFEVIDRADIDKIMKEKGYHHDERFNGSDAGKIGRILNVDGIVVGTVETVSSQVNNNKIGVGLAAGGKKEAEADVSVTIRVLSTQTSQIFLADTANKKEKHSLGTGGGYGAKGGSGAVADAQYPAAYPLTLALQHAADELADKIIAKSASLPPLHGGTQNASANAPGKTAFRGSATGSTTKPPGSAASNSTPPIASPIPASILTVGKVDGKKLYLTGGTNAGITLNQTVEVRRMNGSMKDANGVDIPLEETVEVAVVTEVEERYAVAELLHGDKSAAKVGDKVKLLLTAAPDSANKDSANKGSPHHSKLPWVH
jgi:curli biogenesis system outer membrane secretion channel CsgG